MYTGRTGGRRRGRQTVCQYTAIHGSGWEEAKYSHIRDSTIPFANNCSIVLAGHSPASHALLRHTAFLLRTFPAAFILYLTSDLWLLASGESETRLLPLKVEVDQIHFVQQLSYILAGATVLTLKKYDSRWNRDKTTLKETRCPHHSSRGA